MLLFSYVILVLIGSCRGGDTPLLPNLCKFDHQKPIPDQKKKKKKIERVKLKSIFALG